MQRGNRDKELIERGKETKVRERRDKENIGIEMEERGKKREVGET